ncbi:BREX-1 system adenine-specific DNA-methyltransferase PglX [Paenibacillus naphthalenovorans]|uniref:site-specific DNA-methyltransferase (adenine-specific) n=1 Tax=Paenibacillus naphthalenovorans TaxID=162209 RepID=A0A0U2W8D0_9BACL|nr:BREX-1 system adenine-specific DNA-methyltransferase PglX [Paenibacillus naphthalenovorans]ALS23765.1 SAM-dependent methyltransferase [Paenibacillus naphthalenovorans]GCL74589.1 restriction endonuclease [Paenibacillus naphthalenovorans]
MNKTALKNFATNARNELMKKVEAKAYKIGITEENIKKAQIESSDAIYIDGKQLSLTEKKQRDKLIQRINEIGFKRVIEEVAYTWFNRFVALRFMEVNNYLPTKVRVLSSSNSDNPEPDIIKEALSVDLDIDKEQVYELKVNNKTEELFKYLIIKQCNSLNKYLPFMFETIDDYKEILFPEGLLAKESFLREMTDVTIIPESDWEQVEIIGWLYQFYISEKKDQVFADLKKNIKISKENIPAATQLFTPNWIVRYMVENSLGRLWMESYPDSTLKSEWKYYLKESYQEDEVKQKLEEIRYKNVNPEEITFLDPCCGSGHILVYAFDVLYEMYLEKGYMNHEIPKLILEKNLYGLDIDDRAVQLASFAVMMKAREKSRRVFNQDIKLNICAIQDSNWITEDVINMLVDKRQEQYQQLKQIEMLNNLKECFWNAKEFGSMINVDLLNIDLIESLLNNLKIKSVDLIGLIDKQRIEERLPSLLTQATILSKKFDIVCTNPPYMGSNNMGNYLKDFVQSNYEDSKADLCAVFIEAGLSKTKKNGYCSLVTMHSWFFLSSFEALRKKIINHFTITSILHLGMEAFDGIIGKVVQTVAFVLRNHHIGDYKPIGIRLVDYYDGKKYEKEKQFFNPKHTYAKLRQKDFNKIPGSPIAYWVSNAFIDNFSNKSISDFYEVKSGIMTGNDSLHLRLWYEVNKESINFFCKDSSQMSDFTWFPINKGGDYRVYYGNNDYVINLKNDGEKIKSTSNNYRLRDKKYYFKEGITWSRVTSSNIAFRENKSGTLFGDAGPIIFVERDDERHYLLGLLTSKITNVILNFINPTLNYQVRDIESLPLVWGDKSQVIYKVKENIEISKWDWDSFETSYDFRKHPLLMSTDSSNDTIKNAINRRKEIIERLFKQIKKNAEDINNYFIELYGLKGQLTPEIEDEAITFHNADLEKEIKSFISNAIGCFFGRYSLDEEGLIHAGGVFDISRYKTLPPDQDNILPILSGAYFEDDIVSRFIEFVKVTFGEETLEENLEYIADALGKKDGETAKEAIRRYFLNDFFKDHVQTYKKRPIYWLFTSGKQKAFNCLIYMHRYDKSTLSRIRTDYLHELQNRLEAEKKSLLSIIEGDETAKEISSAKKELKALDLKIEELKAYDELLHHMADMQIDIDLDDGVAVNYAKFNGLLAKLE